MAAPTFLFEFDRHNNDSMKVRFDGAEAQYVPAASHSGCTNATRIFEIAAGSNGVHLVQLNGQTYRVLPSGGSQFSIYSHPASGPLENPHVTPIAAGGFTLHNHDNTKHVTFTAVQPFVLA